MGKPGNSRKIVAPRLSRTERCAICLPPFQYMAKHLKTLDTFPSIPPISMHSAIRRLDGSIEAGVGRMGSRLTIELRSSQSIEMIAINTPPPKPEDRDAQFINFQEEFRRSKRNTLTWSSLLLVASIARDEPGSSGALKVAGTDLYVPHVALVCLLGLACIFFFISFWRSLTIVKTTNSEAALNAADAWDRVDRAIEGIAERLEKPSAAARAYDEELSGISGTADRFLNELHEIVLKHDLPIHAENWQLAKKRFNAEFDDPAPALGNLQRAAKDFENAARSRIDDVRRPFTQAMSLLKNLKADVLALEDRARAQFSTLEGELRDLRQSLAKFRGAIGAREKAYHYALDWVVPISVFAVAIAIAGWRLGDGQSLDALLNQSTLAKMGSHQSQPSASASPIPSKFDFGPAAPPSPSGQTPTLTSSMDR